MPLVVAIRHTLLTGTHTRPPTHMARIPLLHLVETTVSSLVDSATESVVSPLLDLISLSICYPFPHLQGFPPNLRSLWTRDSAHDRVAVESEDPPHRHLPKLRKIPERHRERRLATWMSTGSPRAMLSWSISSLY